jgi:hypothetical protein
MKMNQPPNPNPLLAPIPRMEIPNYSNFQPSEEMVKLRKRVADLMRLGAATPETFGQTIMQVWQECERRRQGCLGEAEDHLRKYHALLSQAGAFAAQASILYSVINGFASLEERRIQETADRAREQAEKEAAQKASAETPAPAPAPEAPAPTTNGHPAQEAAGGPTAKPSGGRHRKKP